VSRHFIGLHQTVYKGPVPCYFHLYQIVIRKVNEIGLKTEYETNDEVRCSQQRPMSSYAGIRSARRRDEGVRTSWWVAGL